MKSALAAIAVSVSLLAQAPGAPMQNDQRPVFRAKVDAVTLDVTVLAKNGSPATDLTAADFEITEQGKPQTIETFELVDMDRRPPMSSNLYHEVRTMASLEQEVAQRDSRLIVVFLDEYHIRRTDQYQVQLQVADVVRDLDPRDLVAIMYPLTPVMGLSFSRDHDADARAISRFQGRQGDYFPPKSAIEEEHVRNLPRIEEHRRNVVKTALEGLCTYLGTLRDTRKQVLYVSTWAPGGMRGFALDDFQRIQRAAARSNTSIYTYDPRGLVSNSMRQHEWLRVLADQTGGRAIVNRNNGREAMKAIVSDSAAYYLIGYTSTENPRDGKFHEVKVKVKRKDVEVRARKGYWAYDAESIERAAAPLPPPVDAEVNAALDAAEVPESGRAVHVWAGVDRDSSGKAVVTVVWEAATGVRDAPIDRADVNAVSDASSAPGAATGTTFRGQAPQSVGLVRLSGSVSFPAAPGLLDVRVVAEDRDGAAIDSARLKVLVPDLASPGFGTPQFFRGRSPREMTMAGALPTAVREFSRGELVTLRVRAFALGAAPAVFAHLVSERGDDLQELAVANGAAGVWEVSLPLGSLGAGRYLVELKAGSVRTLAAFRVK